MLSMLSYVPFFINSESINEEDNFKLRFVFKGNKFHV